MSANQTGGVVLQQVQATMLFQPEQPGPGENLYFLRWDTKAPALPIPLEDTWAESGTPPTSGYFLFLDAPPADATSFEQALRKILSAPTTTAFAWAVSAPTPTVQTLFKTRLNDSNKPCVDGDTQLALLPGSKGVGFGDGSPILAADAGGFIGGFVITYPPGAGAQAPAPSGVSLPLTGACVGCVQFAGLTDSFDAQPGGASALKTLVNVSIDPHRPLDTKRTYETFTGANFILTQDGNSYFITRAS